MSDIAGKIKENIADRIVDVFWVTVKAAVVVTIILLLLRAVPITVKHDGSVAVRQGRGSWYVSVD